MRVILTMYLNQTQDSIKHIKISWKGLGWCLVIFFHRADNNPARIRKIGKDFSKKRYLKDIKFSVKIRDIHNIEK